MAVEIVIGQRLLDPGEAEAVDHRAPLQRLGAGQALVEVDHELHVRADRLPHGVDRRHVVRRPLAAQAQLEAGEAALVAQQDGLLGDLRGRAKPQAVAVVRGHFAHAAAEEHAQRQAGGLREGVPCGHVDAGHGDRRRP